MMFVEIKSKFLKALLIILGIFILTVGVYFLVSSKKPLGWNFFDGGNIRFYYPDWAQIDKENIVDQDNTKIAVAMNSCNFVAAIQKISGGLGFKAFFENVLNSVSENGDRKILSKQISDNAAYIEGQFDVSGVPVVTSSNDFSIGNGEFYALSFLAPKDKFESDCRPYIQKTIDSVRIK